MTFEDPLQFALYARVSTESQEEEGQSLDVQLRMMRECVQKLGGQVVREYRVQESAMPGSDRPSLREMLKDATSGRFDAVMVCKMDRMARAIEVLTHVERSLQNFGIKLFEGSDLHNLRSAEGKLNRGMQALIAEYSVNRLKWSACASRLERARRGWPHSGQLPWGRVVDKTGDRRNQDAKWGLDPEKLQLAQTLYDTYIKGGASLGELGRRFSMNPESIRRIFMEQGGGVWPRQFVDPSTGQTVQVNTQIPPLFSEEQLGNLQARAKNNQMERANWKGRVRDYPLSPYLRCANPDCGWSNLSGHQTIDKRYKGEDGPKYAYYLHLPRSRIVGKCVSSVRAQEIEDEVFGRLGRLLQDSNSLERAVRDALDTSPSATEALRAELAEIEVKQKSAERILRNAMDLLFEQKGTAAGVVAEAKVQSQNKLLEQYRERKEEIQDQLRVVEVPDDFGKRFTVAMRKWTNMHGAGMMHWPADAKREVLRVFFSGGKSTRFDRKGRGVRSDARGIFVSPGVDEAGSSYWKYEVRGLIGDFSGALTDVVALYDRHYSEISKRALTSEELQALAEVVAQTDKPDGFRSSPVTSRPRFG